MLKDKIEKILFKVRHEESYPYKEAIDKILKAVEEEIGEDWGYLHAKEKCECKNCKMVNTVNQAKQEIRKKLK